MAADRGAVCGVDCGGGVVDSGQMKVEAEHQWLAQWRAAAVALRRQKMAELADLSEAEAQRAVLNVLALAGAVRPGHPRWSTSGLVEQQRYLHKGQGE